MSDSLFSASWHRVAGVKPRLRSHVEINRHVYRGAVWYVIKDDASGRYHRFTPQAYCLIGLMDGKRTLDEIWHLASEQLEDDMPSQDEVIKLLSQLYRVDVLQANVIPDVAELNDRRRRQKQNMLLMALKSPLAVKIPLLDPEPFLSSTAGFSRWLFNPLMGVVWLSAIVWALLQAAYHWPALTENLADRVLAAENLFLIFLIYPVVKLVHEFGHAYAIKRWGGEVHEMGVMFLIFMPIPYVDASASASFTSKYQRMLVAAAGILVEGFIAAVAMWVWVSVEPGTMRSVAFNTLLIAGVSTLLFNGNPLLRFDAYYVLADYLEIPNLASRATRQIAHIWKRYLFDFSADQSAAYSRGEAVWLVLYAIASFIYRVFITFAIVIFVASELFLLGIILAIMALYNMFGKPLVQIAKFFVMDRNVRQKRGRVFAVTGVAVALLAAVLFALPVPRMTVAHGIVWAPESSQVLASSSGFIQQMKVSTGTQVAAGDALAVSLNDDLDAEVDETVARLKELMAHHRNAVADSRQNEARILTGQISRARAELARGLEEQQALVIRSPLSGQFQLALPDDPVGRYIPRGTLLGHVLQAGEYRVRVAVRQDDVHLIRSDVQGISARLAERMGALHDASLIREVPMAQKSLPSLALSVDGGGTFALDPASTEMPEAFDRFFVFELGLAEKESYRIGERVYVRFEHTPEPIGYRIYRALRRVLLRELEF